MGTSSEPFEDVPPGTAGAATSSQGKMVTALGTQGRVSPAMTDSPSASPGAHPARSSAHGIGIVAGFHSALTASVVSASSFSLCCMITTSGHR